MLVTLANNFAFTHITRTKPKCPTLFCYNTPTDRIVKFHTSEGMANDDFQSPALFIPISMTNAGWDLHVINLVEINKETHTSYPRAVILLPKVRIQRHDLLLNSVSYHFNLCIPFQVVLQEMKWAVKIPHPWLVLYRKKWRNGYTHRLVPFNTSYKFGN